MFKDYFKVEEDSLEIEVIPSKILETKSDLDTIKKELRSAGLKIKNISPTNFGTEIIFFNKNDAEQASVIIGTDKVKNNSVFIA